jgi:DNA-binding response OmpR family regulator
MRKSILLIDKDPAIIEVITSILTEEGYEVVVSKKPFQINEAHQLAPALILLHNGLNDMGIEICKMLKSDVLSKDIPVVMTSTQSDLPSKAKDSCADAYLQKPFDIDELCELIRKTI